MASREKHELKQEGAIEAAQDENSAVTSDDAQKVIVNETKKAGGEAFQFDPDASPEEKAAQARAVTSTTNNSIQDTLTDLSHTARTTRLPPYTQAQRCWTRVGHSKRTPRNQTSLAKSFGRMTERQINTTCHHQATRGQ